MAASSIELHPEHAALLQRLHAALLNAQRDLTVAFTGALASQGLTAGDFVRVDGTTLHFTVADPA